MSDNIIQLSLPLNPAYLSTVRLTASSLCERAGFNISEVEDVKTAVSEAATCIIDFCSDDNCNNFDISFEILNKSLNVTLSVPSTEFDFSDKDTNLAYKMINGSMDDVKLSKNDENKITTVKLIKNR